jgi:hypothetical protein
VGGALLQLHREDKLMKPLLGSVQSTLYTYRRKRDGGDDAAIVHMPVPTDQGPISQDIYCHFKAEIYSNNAKKETRFQWRDIGGSIPEGFKVRNLQKYFCIDLKQYHDSIEEAIEEQIVENAGCRCQECVIRCVVNTE